MDKKIESIRDNIIVKRRHGYGRGRSYHEYDGLYFTVSYNKSRKSTLINFRIKSSLLKSINIQDSQGIELGSHKDDKRRWFLVVEQGGYKPKKNPASLTQNRIIIPTPFKMLTNRLVFIPTKDIIIHKEEQALEFNLHNIFKENDLKEME
jgi:hypothetical protein